MDSNNKYYKKFLIYKIKYNNLKKFNKMTGGNQNLIDLTSFTIDKDKLQSTEKLDQILILKKIFSKL